jgi:hypothetical protein
LIDKSTGYSIVTILIPGAAKLAKQNIWSAILAHGERYRQKRCRDSINITYQMLKSDPKILIEWETGL